VLYIKETTKTTLPSLYFAPKEWKRAEWKAVLNKETTKTTLPSLYFKEGDAENYLTFLILSTAGDAENYLPILSQNLAARLLTFGLGLASQLLASIPASLSSLWPWYAQTPLLLPSNRIRPLTRERAFRRAGRGPQEKNTSGSSSRSHDVGAPSSTSTEGEFALRVR
jgi:hypothetical protein